MKNNSFNSLCFLLVVLFTACSILKPVPVTLEERDWVIAPFEKVDSLNPILKASASNQFTCPILKKNVAWQRKDVFNPAVVVRDGKIWMIYRAEDTIGKYAGTSRLGLASSIDGLHFKTELAPIFYPDEDKMKMYEWEGGCEDPRIVQRNDGTYIMTYTAYDGKTARLCLASSLDLRHWTKHGLVLGEGKYRNTWSKSGAIVCKRQGEQMVAQKVKGKYWMYWGDLNLYMATSDDLIHWAALENQDGSFTKVLSPRNEGFDSGLVESGPYALMSEKGIVLIYNAANKGFVNDPKASPENSYKAGQALFNLNNPTQLLGRTAMPFLAPDRPYEIEGQVNRVVFLEGLAYFKKNWFLYYGTADSKIGVAVKRGTYLNSNTLGF
jgi:beta-1,2-mannosidase